MNFEDVKFSASDFEGLSGSRSLCKDIAVSRRIMERANLILKRRLDAANPNLRAFQAELSRRIQGEKTDLP